jgi:hypothetical protein
MGTQDDGEKHIIRSGGGSRQCEDARTESNVINAHSLNSGPREQVGIARRLKPNRIIILERDTHVTAQSPNGKIAVA